MVGPNGSGKSNVIDAMLFVFGKRAKQLRLNKVSELIHNSTHHRNLGEARVSVHFQEIVDIVSERGSARRICRSRLPLPESRRPHSLHSHLATHSCACAACLSPCRRTTTALRLCPPLTL